MKKLLLLFIVLISVSIAKAEIVSIDDLYYDLDSSTQTASVASGNKVSGAITIPETVIYQGMTYSVTSIGQEAFCFTDLRSIEIPSSVTSISTVAFIGCYFLTSFIVDTNNPSFSAVEGVLYSKNKDILILYPTGLIGGFEIPNFVTSIGDHAFDSCMGLTSIEIPNSVIKIGNEAFVWCYGLTSVVIPNSVTSIGDYAFWGCEGLTSVVIGNSVSTIGDEAFSGCLSLTSVVIGNSVTSIGIRAFDGCEYLTSFLVDPDNPTFSSMEGVLYSKNKDMLIVYPAGLKGSFEIPNSVTSIEDYAFSQCRGLTSIEIPNSVTSIGDEAFYVCSGLTNVVIPNSVTSIGNNAFKFCYELTSVVIDNSVTSIGEYAFSWCKNLTSIELGSSVTSIGNDAFQECSGLTSVVIPNSVTSIGDYAFTRTGLTTFVIPNSVTSVGKGAFSNCSDLTSIEIPNSVTSINNYTFSYCSSLTSVVIPISVTSIGYSAFEGCSALTSIEIPNSVTSIGGAAFNNIEFDNFTIEDGLETLEWISEPYIIENRINTKNLYFGRTSNGPLSFTGVESLEVSGFIESISSNCFINNPITSLVINPGSGIVIEDGAFSGCTSLADVTLPEDIAEIGANAFSGTAIKEITVPNGIVGNNAFANCNLENITIGAGVESIGEMAFDGNNAIRNVYATPATPPAAENNTFSSYEAPLYVPFEAINAYSNSSRCWNLFNCQSLVMPESLTVSGPTDINGEPGETFQLSATIIPSNVTLDRVLWTSTNPAIATVDNNGLVTIQNFVAGGNVRARANTMEGGCEIIASTLYDNSPVAVVRIGSFSTSIDYINSDDIAEGSHNGIAQNDIFTLQGVCLKRNASQSDIDSLVRGIYIIGGKKVVVK